MYKMFKRIWKQQAHHPTLPLGLIVNDFYLPRKAIESFVNRHARNLSGRILDIGCGSKPYKSFFECTEYIGIDIPNPVHKHDEEDIDMLYDGKTLPFGDNSFHSIVCFEVLEHVFEPTAFLKEMYRVVKPNGSILLTCPFIFNEHEEPNDYGRYSSFGIVHLLSKTGFTVVTLEKLLDGPEMFALAGIIYLDVIESSLISCFNSKSSKLIVYLVFRPFVLLLNLSGVVLSRFPRTGSIYFNNGVLFRKES